MLKDLIRKTLLEATSDSSGNGSFIAPLQPGMRKFKETQLGPYTDKVSKYDSPMLDYDSYDGKMDETPNKRKKNRVIG